MILNEVVVRFEDHKCTVKEGTSEVLETIKSQLQKQFAEFGLDVTVNKIYNEELFVKNYYAYSGYTVIYGCQEVGKKFLNGPIKNLSDLKKLLDLKYEI